MVASVASARPGVRVLQRERPLLPRDTNGVHWIIEGKDERGRDDARVQAKRKAAETLVRRLVAEDACAGQHWGYLIAYEQDTARADLWEDLKAFASPVSNAL